MWKFLAVLLAFAGSANAAIFGIGVSTKDELAKMKALAEMEEELSHQKAIVDTILKIQNEKKSDVLKSGEQKGFGKVKADIKSLEEQLQETNSAIQTLESRVKTLESDKAKLAQLEKEIADKESKVGPLKAGKFLTTTAGYLTRAMATLGDISMFSKRILNRGDKISSSINQELEEDLKVLEADIGALYKVYEGLQAQINEINKLPELKTQYDNLILKIEIVQKTMGILKRALHSWLQNNISKPLSNEGERIVKSLNALIVQAKCSKIKGLGDLKEANITYCKEKAWKAAQKKASKVGACKSIKVSSASTQIESCLVAYTKSKK